jgi:prephenate dehydratase
VTRLAHLGPRGTYTEAAAALHDPHAQLLPTPTVAEAVAVVERDEADGCVCALENSLEGGVRETLDQLLREDLMLAIAGEVVLPIRHALLGAADADTQAATVVYSHPQALAQCRRRLTAVAPAARPVAALSTSAAIESAIAEPGALAIGNAHAAELYGARVLVPDLADEPDNETRFVVLAPEDRPPTGDDKTSIAFTTQHDRPGSLVEVLTLFAGRGINLTRVESRPTRRQLGTYVFLLDMEGHRTDPPLADALAALATLAEWQRLLGSYPRWRDRRAAHEQATDER